MKIAACIMPTTSAATAVIDWMAMGGRAGCFSVIGALSGAEEIAIQRPLVASPGPFNDSDWTTLTINDIQAVLRVGHDAEPVPVSMVLRVSKPETVNAVGVGWA